MPSRFTVPINEEPDADRQQEIEAEKADAWQDQAVDREAEEQTTNQNQ